jgi:hypothetical protein
VVCYNRLLEQSGDPTFVNDVVVPVATLVDSVNGVSAGGGSVVLGQPISNPLNGKSLKENDWVALVSAATTERPAVCCWYRVVAVGDPTTHLALAGPDWLFPANQTQAVVPAADVIGVYTTIVEVDRNPTWMK